jgi:hypothetical protein
MRDLLPASSFTTLLNAPCSSLILTQSDPPTLTIYLIVGKIAGEVIFFEIFPADRLHCVSRFESDVKAPITAIAAGDLRNTGRAELVVIQSNGLLQSLNYPGRGNSSAPTLLFSQQLYSNICSAEVRDIDGDGQCELVVVMTDRVGE